MVRANERASWASLGRDQGIFQYVAWAVGEGELAYRDVRDVNGPVIPMVHSFFQLLGGRDEHRFRSLDLIFTGASFLIAGACVPRFTAPKPKEPPAAMTTHVAWAVATWVALSAQYVVYGFWDTAQRESFLDWFVLVSLAIFALTVGAAELDRRAKLLLAVSGALSFVPWLGKPTFAIFTLAQIATLLFIQAKTAKRRDRLRELGWFLRGGAIGILPPLLFLLVRGDLRSFVKITFVDVPTMYRFIWPRPASAILFLPGYQQVALLAAGTSFGLLVLVLLRHLPVRAIPIALMPAFGLVSVIIQAKGFPYHFHPVTLGTTFGWIVALASVWNAKTDEVFKIKTIVFRLAVAVGAVVVGARASLLASVAPYPDPPPANERDAASLESAARLAAFDRVDFFPRALRDAAQYVEKQTGPSDRIQMYGMDAYLLFLANRKSATPYVYVYDLNADAALAGSYDPGGIHPTAAEAARIRALRDAHANDLLDRLQNAPPAAFVFIDRSPLMSYVDSVFDFSAHCPDAARWVATNYRQTADFEGIRIWLRNDVSEK